MVGGNDFRTHPFNLATNGHRQPGSSFKPFTLATALGQGISPSTTYTSQREDLQGPALEGRVLRRPQLRRRVLRQLILENCTIHSDNSCYAELALGDNARCVQGCGGSPAVKGGTKAIARTAHRMGIGTKFSTNPSMVLGAIDPGVTPLEMAYAYTTISHGGQRVGGNLDATAGPNNTPV